jgi:hypothetical protein
MLSPFPGMDPYLERVDRWSGVHAGLIAVLRESLARQVAPRFFVDSEDNVFILGLDDPARSLVRPDIYLVEAGRAGSPPAPRGTITAPLVLDLPAELEIRAPYLRIIDTSDRHVVANVEILSPINKVAGSRGQREQILQSDPLQSPAADVPLDLQAAVETVYDRYRYDTVIDYSEEPPPSLWAADALWLRERIDAWRSARRG